MASDREGVEAQEFESAALDGDGALEAFVGVDVAHAALVQLDPAGFLPGGVGVEPRVRHTRHEGRVTGVVDPDGEATGDPRVAGLALVHGMDLLPLDDPYRALLRRGITTDGLGFPSPGADLQRYGGGDAPWSCVYLDAAGAPCDGAASSNSFK